MTIKPTNQGWPQFGDLACETALPVTANVSRTDGQTVLSSMDTLFGGMLEDRSARFVGGGTISLSTNGQTLTFGERLDLVYNNAGATEVITSIIAAAGTLTFSTGTQAAPTFAYIVLTKGSPGSAALTSNASTLPAATTSQEVFLLATRRDDISGIQRVYLSDGTSILSGQSGQLGGGGSGGLTPSYQATTFTAVTNQNYLTNTTSAAFTATLPTGAAGDTIQFVDGAGTWGTHNLTIAPATGQSIQGISGTGAAGALVANLSGAFIQLSWDNTNSYWTVTSSGFQYGPTYNPTVTGGIVPSSGLPGNNVTVYTANSYTADILGEYFERNVVSNVSLTSGTTADVDATGITLTAGTWDISGSIQFTPTASTSITKLSAWVGTATGNVTTGQDTNRNYSEASFAANIPGTTALITQTLPVYRVSISTNTAYFLKALTAFTLSTLTANGNLRATRVL